MESGWNSQVRARREPCSAPRRGSSPSTARQAWSGTVAPSVGRILFALGEHKSGHEYCLEAGSPTRGPGGHACTHSTPHLWDTTLTTHHALGVYHLGNILSPRTTLWGYIIWVCGHK